MEFVAAAIIASYAMIGGAVLNAAITSPWRCSHVLSWLYPWFRPLAAAAVGLVVLSLVKNVHDGAVAGTWSDPLFWIAMAQVILLSLFGLAQRFVIEASKGDPNHGRSTDEHGHRD